MPFHGPASTVALGALTPARAHRGRRRPGSVRSVDASFDAPRPSPHLARWGIAAQDDDGIVVARATIDGAPVLFAAQDERFLGGSAGANHADALRRLFERGTRRASGRGRPPRGIRRACGLHEANPAEWALARALAALLDLRAAGIPRAGRLRRRRLWRRFGAGLRRGTDSAAARSAARTVRARGHRDGARAQRGRRAAMRRRRRTFRRPRRALPPDTSKLARRRGRRPCAVGSRACSVSRLPVAAWVQRDAGRLAARLEAISAPGLAPIGRAAPGRGGGRLCHRFRRTSASLYADRRTLSMPRAGCARLPRSARAGSPARSESGSFGSAEAHALDASLLANFAVGGSDARRTDAAPARRFRGPRGVAPRRSAVRVAIPRAASRPCWRSSEREACACAAFSPGSATARHSSRSVLQATGDRRARERTGRRDGARGDRPRHSPSGTRTRGADRERSRCWAIRCGTSRSGPASPDLLPDADPERLLAWPARDPPP